MLNNLHRGSAPQPCAPQLETLICWSWWELGAEIQAAEDRPKKRTGVGYEDSARRGWTVIAEGVSTIEARCHCWGVCKERGGTTGRASSPVRTFRQQDNTYKSCKYRCEPPPPLWAPEAGSCWKTCWHVPGLGVHGPRCPCETCEWVKVPGPIVPGECEPRHICKTHEQAPGPGPSCSGRPWGPITPEKPMSRCQVLSPLFWEGEGPLHPYMPYQGDNGKHTLRKEAANI